MPVNKRRKFSRQRGSWTHGWGEKKKHRGSGNKGGVGMASSGKRSDAKKPSIWKTDYFGKKGFISKGPKQNIKAVNLDYIERNFDKLVANKKIMLEGGFFAIDLASIGNNKLLGKGNATRKFKIKADYASKNAVDAVKEAGGEVLVKFAEKSEANTDKSKIKPKLS